MNIVNLLKSYWWILLLLLIIYYAGSYKCAPNCKKVIMGEGIFMGCKCWIKKCAVKHRFF